MKSQSMAQDGGASTAQKTGSTGEQVTMVGTVKLDPSLRKACQMLHHASGGWGKGIEPEWRKGCREMVANGVEGVYFGRRINWCVCVCVGAPGPQCLLISAII